MKKVVLFIFHIFLLVACNEGVNTLDIPDVHMPAQTLSRDLLKNYVLSYCWQYPEGRVSQNDPSDREVVVVVTSGDGLSKELIRNPYNLRTNVPDTYAYKSGCVEEGNSIRYISNGLAWRPNHNALTFTSGSDPYLTDFDYYEISEELKTLQRDFPVTRKEYGGFFGEPRGIYWSPDGQRFATLGIDVGLESSGANIWVHDLGSKSMVRVTAFRDIGEYVVNATWSKNEDLLAIGYGRNGGVGIVKFERGNIQNFSYVEVASGTHSQIGKWPYVYENVLDLMLNQSKISYNSYVYTASQPVWINNDRQLVFTAADENQVSALFVVNSDGSSLEKLLPDLSGNLYLPKLSPDGETLVFVRNPNWSDSSKVEIGEVNLITKEVQSLIVMPAPEDGSNLLISGLAWSPDGRYLAFSSNHQGESDIYIMSANGDSWLNLTEDYSGNVVSPIWKP